MKVDGIDHGLGTPWEIDVPDDSIVIENTDLGLPGMRGGELSAAARVLRPGMRIVVASGYSAEDANIPADAVFLQKPFDLPQLKRALGMEA